MCSFAAGRAVRKRAAAKRERGTRLRRWAPLYQGGERRYMPIYIKCMQTTAAAQKSTYPGVAQLVARLLWERRGGIRDKARWNAAKPCDTCVCGIFLDCRKRHKSGFDHINDHRQKNLWFSPLPWYNGRNWISGCSAVGSARDLGEYAQPDRLTS